MDEVTKLAELEERAKQVHGQYMLHFADQSRLTRRIGTLEGLIEASEEVVVGLRSLTKKREDVVELEERVSKRLAMYREEVELIREAQTVGPQAIEVAMIMGRVDILREVYKRHYAGASRITRDWLQLDNLVDDLSDHQEALSRLASAYGSSEGLRSGLDLIGRELKLYRSEVREIKDAQTGAEGERLFSLLAELANAQFTNYRRYFADMGRGTRHLPRLERIISNLRLIAGKMKRLNVAVLSAESKKQHLGNIEIVRTRTEAFQAEMSAVTEAIDTLTPKDRIAGLRGEAHRILAAYREEFAGRDRRTRDLELLSGLCDRMQDVEIELRVNGVELEGLEERTDDHAMALDALGLLIREYNLVKDSQQ